MIRQYIKNFFDIKIASSVKSIKPMIQNDMQSQKQKYSNSTLNDIVKFIQNTVQKYIENGANQKSWFFDRYIAQKCHIEDFQEGGSLIKRLQDLKKYSQLNKQVKKKMRLTKDVSLQQMSDFVNKKYFIQDEKKFETPNLPKISIPNVSNYNVYSLSGADYNDFRQVNRIYAKAVSWCVVTGTRSWGSYLSDKYYNYYMVTNKSNQPILLMNFGKQGQIKNIRNSFFSAYDNQIFEIVNYLLQRDGFNPENNQDFKNYIKLKKVMDDEINIQNLQKVTEIGKYTFYKEGKDFYAYIDKIPCFIFSNEKYLIKVGKSHVKIDQNIIQFIEQQKLNEIAYNLLYDKVIQNQNGKLFDSLFDMVFNFIKSKLGNSYLLIFITEKIIQKDRQDLIQRVISNIDQGVITQNFLKKIIQSQAIDFNQPYMQTIINKLTDSNLVNIIEERQDMLNNPKLLGFIKNRAIQLNKKAGQMYTKDSIDLLLAKKIIQQKDPQFKQIFRKKLHGYYYLQYLFPFFYKLLDKNGQNYKQMLEYILSTNPSFLLQRSQIKQNSEYYNKAIDALIQQENTSKLQQLIVNKYITKKSKKYQQIIKYLVSNDQTYQIKQLLKYNRINKNSQDFIECINNLLQNDPSSGYYLILYKTITPDMQQFNQIVQRLIRVQNSRAMSLILQKLIPITNIYFKAIIQKYLQDYRKSAYQYNNYQATKNNFIYNLIVSNIIPVNSQIFDYVLSKVAQKDKNLLYYLLRYVITDNVNNYIEMIKLLQPSKISKLISDNKVVESNKYYKQILQIINQKNSWYLFNLLFKSAINKNNKYFNFAINLLMKQNSYTYYIYYLIDNWNITDNMPIFDKCIKYLIKHHHNKRQMKTLYSRMRSDANMYEPIKKYVQSSRLPFDLYQLSRKIISKQINQLNKVFRLIFNQIKNKNFVIKCSQSIEKILQNNTIICQIKMKKDVDFIDKINIVTNVQKDKFTLSLDVFCKDNVLDNKYYIPIQRILNESHKQFQGQDAEEQLKEFLDDIFTRFDKVYTKQKQTQVLNQDEFYKKRMV